MTGTQHDAYGEELARIGRHQGEAVTARLRLFEVLAAAGVPAAEADVLVSRLEAGAVAGAHTWVSESSAPHGSQQPFEPSQPYTSPFARRKRMPRWRRVLICEVTASSIQCGSVES